MFMLSFRRFLDFTSSARWFAFALGLLLAACGGGSDSQADLRRGPLAVTAADGSAYDPDDLYRFFAIAFGAAPGVTYQSQLLEAANAGMSIQRIVTVFTTKTQFTEVYPESLSNVEFAQRLVENVVGSTATAQAKQAAVADIVAALSLPNWSRGDVIYAIFNNLARKPADDPLWAGTASKLANQVTYARYFTETLKADTQDLEVLRRVVRPVSSGAADRPVAVAAQRLYRPPSYVILDGGMSFDPRGAALQHQWEVVSGPPGFVGFGYLDQRGRAGFSADTGTYQFRLTVHGSTASSVPVDVTVEVCCSNSVQVEEGANFIAKLPVYSIEQARKLFAAWAPQTLDDQFRFASQFGFSTFHLDFLAGRPAGDTLRKALDGKGFDAVPPAGGATITDYALGLQNVIKVPSSVNEVAYPADYTASKAVDILVKDPFCDTRPAFNFFPSEYLGKYAMPAVNAVPLGEGVLKMAGFVDAWFALRPNGVDGCFKDMRESFAATLDRLERLGANTVVLTPWTTFDGSGATWKVVQQAAITDGQFEWAVAQAKRRGFKVYWMNQIQVASRNPDGTGYYDSTNTTSQDVLRAMEALVPHLEERGAFLQRLGVDGVLMGPWYWVNFEGYLDAATFAERTGAVLRAMKKNFTGKLAYDVSAVLAQYPAVSSLIDHYRLGPTAFCDATTMDRFSVADLKDQFQRYHTQPFPGSRFPAYKDLVGQKPIIWEPRLDPRQDQFTNPGFVELTFCMPDASSNCGQRKHKPDFSMQAILLEAQLEFIASLPRSTLAGVSFPYWLDDNLYPTNNFPNLSGSIRAKPAEAIAYRWFNAR